MGQRVSEVFRMFDTGVVADALDEHGIDGVLTGFETADDSWSAVGRAHTMRFEEVDESTTGTTGATEATEETNFPYAMLNELVEDRVLVVSGTDAGISCWGGNASLLAAAAGTNGVVVDGGYRDVPEIGEGSFPVFGRARTPRTGQRRVTVDAVGEAITVDDVEIAPDDVVVADATGVVVVPADEAESVAGTAEGILSEELVLREKIANGATVADLQRDGHTF